MADVKISAIASINADLFSLLLEADPSEEIIRGYINRAYKFVAQLNDIPVGILLLLDTHPNTVEIVNIAVSKDFRNQGIGSTLLGFSTEWAKGKKYKVIEIGTGSTSFEQLYLYQKFGFRPFSIDHDFFVKNYNQPIIENNLVLKDMIRLQQYL